MPPRLEIEITGTNTQLKKVLRESLTQLNNFNKALDFKPTGINALKTSLGKTKTLLKDITTLANSARSALGGISPNNSAGSTVSNTQQAADLNAARVATENYRTETQRLRSSLQALRLQQVQNRQQTTASSDSYRQAQQQLTALGAAIRNAEGGFRSNRPAIQSQINEYRRLNDELKAFDAELGNHQRDVGRYGKALEGLKGLALSYFGFSALISGAKQVLQSNAQISDSLADVRRTAGLTAKEADSLAESLKNINTRTSLKDLLGISVIGGQLGITKKQLVGFTKAVDELAVSLGGELAGGAEGIAKSLGVLDNVFGITKRNAGDVEKSYNQIGSAILGLGQSGLATGDFLADFGERVGGVAKQAGLSLPVILSYGAVLQENGVTAEVAGSAFKRLISAISSNSAKFYAVAKFADANLTLKAFNTLVNTDTKKALDLFFTGINRGGSSTIAFNTILKSLKISGAGASQVVSALANNLPELSKHIQESTKDFEEATKSGEQFLIKNDNLAGSVDKLGKAFENITTSGAISSFFKSIVDGATESVKAIGVLSEAVSTFYNLATRPKDFIGETSQSAVDLADQQNKNAGIKSGSTQIRNQVGQKEAFESIQKEIKLLVELDKKYKDLNAEYVKIKPSDRVLTDTYAVAEARKNIIFQKGLVQGLKKEYDDLYRTVKRSNAAVPDAFVKTPKTKDIPVNRAPEILRQSGADVDLTGLSGVDKQVEEVRLKYIKFYQDLFDNAKKSAEGRKTLEADLATLQKNEVAENSKIITGEQQRVADEVERINNVAAVKVAETKTREIAEITKRYDAEILKAGDASNIIIALENAKGREVEAVNQKYDLQRLEDQKDLVDKIQTLAEKEFTLNENFSNRTTARNKATLKDRLKDVSDYFTELRKLYVNNPLALVALGAAEGNIKQGITDKQNVANSQGGKKLFEDFITGFGSKFYQTLSGINQLADKSFRNIVGSLGESITGLLQDTFSTQLGQILKDLVSGVGLSTTQALSAIAGIAGGLISGATKKTDTLGQAGGGALSGAASGALAGSVIPGLGTIAGAVIGGVLGAAGGILGASKARKEEKALQQQQLDEAKKQTELLRQNALTYTSAITGRMTDQGILTKIDIGAMGELTADVSGNKLKFVLARANNSRSN